MAKILLVEDDNNLREIYEARLTAEGYEIISAQNGEEALVLAKQHYPDLIISDVMMPRISGYEMLDILRNTEGIKDTKVIMLTALGQAEDKDRAGKLGADKYLVKSQVTLEDIVNSTKALLASDATAAAPADDTAATSIPSPADTSADQVSSVPDAVIPSADPVAAPLASSPTLPPESSVIPEPLTQALPAADPSPQDASSTFTSPSPEPTTAPPVAPMPEPSGTPVSVDDIIETQPDAQGQIDASTEQIEQVQSTPLSETDLLTGEQRAIAEEEAALAQQISGSSAPAIEPLTPPAEPSAVVSTPLETAIVPPVGSTSMPAAVVNEEPLSNPDPSTPQTTETIVSQAAPETDSTPDAQTQPMSTDAAAVETAAPVDPDATMVTPTLQSSQETGLATPATIDESAVQSNDENEHVTVAGKKVIQPPMSTSSKPDLSQLLAQEEAKEASETMTTSDDTTVQPMPQAADAPTSPDVVPQPLSTPEQPEQLAPPKRADGFDPNSVAL